MQANRKIHRICGNFSDILVSLCISLAHIVEALDKDDTSEAGLSGYTRAFESSWAKEETICSLYRFSVPYWSIMRSQKAWTSSL